MTKAGAGTSSAPSTMPISCSPDPLRARSHACERNAIVCSGWDPDFDYGLDGFVTRQPTRSSAPPISPAMSGDSFRPSTAHCRDQEVRPSLGPHCAHSSSRITHH